MGGRPSARDTRVVVTGIGAITAAGPSTAALRAALHGGTTCIGSADAVRRPTVSRCTSPARCASCRTPRCCRAPAASARRAPTASRWWRSRRRCATAASRLPLADPARVGVAIGSSTGGMLETEAYYSNALDGPSRAGVARAPRRRPSVAAPTGLVAAALGATGPRLSPSTACSSGAIALAIGGALDPLGRGGRGRRRRRRCA